MGAVAGYPSCLPTDDGIPVNQWSMSATDADGAKMTHDIAEYGVEAKPGNRFIVLAGDLGAEHGRLVPAIKPLVDRFRFMLYGQRGSLRPTATAAAEVTCANLIKCIDQLRQRLGLEQVALMAHSQGNMLAYGYLRAHPDRVAGRILVGRVPPRNTSGMPKVVSDV